MIEQHQVNFSLGLKPMLSFMSKHGMPDQFPQIWQEFDSIDNSNSCTTFFSSTDDFQFTENVSFW